ncbi:MAG: transglycosylase domain-containing protein, partial [Saprospiraceae bacterium]|nr:transglycosylase domain-containing protein [Saprospiraceae bacterium]
MEQQQNTKKKRSPIRRLFWTLFGAGVMGLSLLFLLTSWGVFGKLPSFQELENPDLAVATEVYGADGEMLGKIYRKNRVNVTYDQLPKHLVHAVVATEDERFFKHSGIDLKATIRAFVLLGRKGGGSTITQQLAKNLLEQGRDQRSIRNTPKRIVEKVKEYIIATRLEKRYTKEEILAMYLNQFEFVNNAIGVQSASKVYFSKTVQELDSVEVAVFAGMLKNPSAFNPKQNPNDSKARRNVVFRQMEKNNFISKAEKEALQARETVVRFQKDDHNTGLAPYLRSVIQNDVLKKWIEENPRVDGEKYDMYRD